MAELKTIFRDYLHRLNTGTRVKTISERELEELQAQKDKPVIINIVLFVITFLTTSLAGASSGDSFIEYVISGLPYSLTIITILLTHEFGHYFAAKSFGVRATLPYFIPFPSLIGTMGAVIRVKSPIPHRRALFYIGAMGPLAGFAVSIVAVVAGISLSEVKSLPPGGGEVPIPIFGDSILFAMIVKFFHGAIPEGKDIFLSPYAWAGWIGFLVTSINLMPVGQLDGSHILYALIGEKQKVFGWGVLVGLGVLSFFWHGWVIWIFIIVFFLMVAHPPTAAGKGLNLFEKGVGWFCMVIFILTFIPIPVEVI
jgi:membrane-associated protease RseP (regulator of RpoE activity)